MKRKPRNPNETIFFGIKRWLIPIPIILASISLLLFAFVLQANGWNSDFAVEKARTMVFGVIGFFELFFALSCRSFTHNINRLGLFSNRILLYSLLGESSAILFIMNYPAMQELFDFVSLEAADWILLLLLAITGFVYSEIIKFIASRKKNISLFKLVPLNYISISMNKSKKSCEGSPFKQIEKGSTSTPKIRWKRLTPKGETCPRCGSTEEELRKAVSILKKSFAPLGIKVILEKEELSVTEFKKDPLQFNRIWINNRLARKIGLKERSDIALAAMFAALRL